MYRYSSLEIEINVLVGRILILENDEVKFKIRFKDQKSVKLFFCRNWKPRKMQMNIWKIFVNIS